MQTSIIYRNIQIYRILMTLIYSGSYKQRFQSIKKFLSKSNIHSVVELCFGDTFIAEYCKKNDIKWTGFDINAHFVTRAKKQGFNAIFQDLSALQSIPETDVCIMIGSLYHFNNQLEDLFNKIFQATSCFIISEPVKNLSNQKGLIGYIARRSANAGKGDESFRYNRETFGNMLEQYSTKFNFNYEILGFVKKDMIVVLKKK